MPEEFGVRMHGTGTGTGTGIGTGAGAGASLSSRRVGAHGYMWATPHGPVNVALIASGDFLTTSVIHAFLNPVENLTAMNASYVCALPAAAVVRGVTARFSESGAVFTGRVKCKEQAKAEFQRAINRGEQAVHVQQDTAANDLYTFSIGVLAPGEIVTIELSYSLQMDIQFGKRIVLPTGITGKYVSPADTRGVLSTLATSGSPPTSRVTRVTVEVSAASPLVSVSCPSHAGFEFAVNPEQPQRGTGVLVIDGPGGFGGSDFVLDIAESAPGNSYVVMDSVPGRPEETVLSAVMRTTDKDGGMMFKASTDDTGRSVGVGVLLDLSGSMAGWRLQVAKKVVQEILNTLPEDVLVWIDVFGDLVNTLVPGLPSGDRAEIMRHVNLMQANMGGTDIAKAVDESLKHPVSHVIIVTDAFVSGAAGGIKCVIQRSSIMVSMIAIGDAACSDIVRVVEDAGGITRRVLHPNDVYLDSIKAALAQPLAKPTWSWNLPLESMASSSLSWLQTSPADAAMRVFARTVVRADIVVKTLALQEYLCGAGPGGGAGEPRNLRCTLTAGDRSWCTTVFLGGGSGGAAAAVAIGNFLRQAPLAARRQDNVRLSEWYQVLGPYTSIVGAASNVNTDERREGSAAASTAAYDSGNDSDSDAGLDVRAGRGRSRGLASVPVPASARAPAPNVLRRGRGCEPSLSPLSSPSSPVEVESFICDYDSSSSDDNDDDDDDADVGRGRGAGAGAGAGTSTSTSRGRGAGAGAGAGAGTSTSTSRGRGAGAGAGVGAGAGAGVRTRASSSTDDSVDEEIAFDSLRLREAACRINCELHDQDKFIEEIAEEPEVCVRRISRPIGPLKWWQRAGRRLRWAFERRAARYARRSSELLQYFAAEKCTWAASFVLIRLIADIMKVPEARVQTLIVGSTLYTPDVLLTLLAVHIIASGSAFAHRLDPQCVTDVIARFAVTRKVSVAAAAVDVKDDGARLHAVLLASQCF